MSEAPTPQATPHEIADLNHVRDIARSVIEQDLQIPQSLWPEQIALAVHEAGFRRPKRINTIEELALLPNGTVVRSDEGTIACRFDAERGVILGDERAFPWGILSTPATILWEVQQ